MACESLNENECSLGDACTIGIGPGDTSLGKDAVSVSEALAEGWNLLDTEELEIDAEDIILDLSMALGLKKNSGLCKSCLNSLTTVDYIYWKSFSGYGYLFWSIFPLLLGSSTGNLS